MGWLAKAAVMVTCMVGAAAPAAVRAAPAVADLAGDWEFRIDPENVGVKQGWAGAALPEKVHLPGSLQAQGFGDEVSVNTPWMASRTDKSWYTDERYTPYRQPGKTKVSFWLTPARHYIGAAWYRREVGVPQGWAGRRVVLRLERCHWQTTLFVDGKEIGTRDSLATAHEYDLGDVLPPGKHALALRVDNSLIVNVGRDAHSVSDHTQTDWNGVIGRIDLTAGPRTWVDDVQVYPDVRGKRVRVTATVGNATGKPAAGKVTVKVGTARKQVSVDVPGEERKVELELPLGDDTKPWDEFSPNLYTAEVSLDCGGETDSKAVTFGMRELGQAGTQLAINGRKLFVRGTLECCSFPLTGYPATDVAEWKRIVSTCKAYGLNSIRFHSWCPPEAAFVAADELGFYYQVEGPEWANPSLDDPKVQAFDRAECDRILKAYGNHPSFCFMTYGNEPGGKHQKEFFEPLVEHWKREDPRHKYCCASGWPALDVNDFQMTPDPRVQRWGEGLKSRINDLPPATTANYVHGFVDKWPMPVITHEMGQWCVYPDFKEIAKYTGFLKAGNFEIFRDSLREHHMLDQADDFLRASGKLQVLCYKEDIEATMRTPGFGGFQLLGLQDFPGQGTALVGVLSVFWQGKGYVNGPEYRRFCCETVPLAVMDKRVYTPDEAFAAMVRIAHFGPAPIEHAKPVWTLTDGAGRSVAAGELPIQDVAVGNDQVLGKVAVPLQSIAKATKLTFTVSLDGTPYANDWDVWVYPPVAAPAGDVKVVDDPADAEKVLASGGKALLVLPPSRVKGDPKLGPVGLGFSSIFWNTSWTGRQAPHTLGILCDPKHPAFADFPTEDHTNWQWWYLVHGARPMILDGLPPTLRPIVQVIDDWVTNRRLALAFEAKVGAGKLLMTTIDLNADPKANPVAAQLRASLLRYANSDRFDPSVELTAEQVTALTKPASLYQKLGARITADSEEGGFEAANLLEDPPADIWHTSWHAPLKPYPHQLVIELARPVAIRGVKAQPRQDGNQNGWIKAYAVYVSDDGKSWGHPVATGEFPRNAAWKTVPFDHPVTTRFVRLVALSPWGEKPYASLARFELMPAE